MIPWVDYNPVKLAMLNIKPGQYVVTKKGTVHVEDPPELGEKANLIVDSYHQRVTRK